MSNTNINQVIPGANGNHTYIGGLAQRLATESNARYCIQCTDKISGKTGDFIHFGDFQAATEVFPGLQELFQHMNAIGWEIGGNNGPCSCQRKGA